jgi:hypothetical protein
LRARILRAGREVAGAVLGGAREATPRGGWSGGRADEGLEEVVPFDELLADVQGRSDASRPSPRATLDAETDP